MDGITPSMDGITPSMDGITPSMDGITPSMEHSEIVEFLEEPAGLKTWFAAFEAGMAKLFAGVVHIAAYGITTGGPAFGHPWAGSHVRIIHSRAAVDSMASRLKA
jgi:hypothetical protein